MAAPTTPVHNVAHRGYSAVAPENTLPAFAAAVLAGATFVEFDVRTSADGVPVVIHDPTVDRTTDGTGAVAALSAADLAALDAGSWFSPAYAGARVPRLDEVLDLFAAAGPAARDGAAAVSAARDGTAAPLTAGAPELLLEIKPPATAAEVDRILGMVAERGLTGRTVVQSFAPDVVRLVARAAPRVRRGLLRDAFDPDQVGVARELGVVTCNPSSRAVLAEPDTVARLAAAGVAVMPWTPNDPAQWPALVDAGVAGLITDRAGELTGWTHG